MRRRRFTTLILALCCGINLGYAAPASVLVLNDTNASPFTTPQQDGFLDIVVGEAMRRAGVQLQLTKLPAERALLSADRGLIDGDLTRIAGLGKRYPNLIPVPEKLVDWEFVAFSKNPDIRSDWSTLRGHRVGHITGWKIYEKALAGSEQVVSATTPTQLFKLLDLGRIDIALHARWMGHGHIKALRLQGIQALSPPLAKREMYIYLNKRHNGLADKIAEALRALKQEGFYQRTWDEKIGPFITTP